MANRKACKVLEVPSATLIYLLTFYVYRHILPKKLCLLFLIFFLNNVVHLRFPRDGSTKLNSTIAKHTMALKMCVIKRSKVSAPSL